MTQEVKKLIKLAGDAVDVCCKVAKTACPLDTNGDGDCGRIHCPFCGLDEVRFQAAQVAADLEKARAG